MESMAQPNGYTTGTLKARSPEERFWSHVDPCRTDGCALWLAQVDPNGYGRFYPADGVAILAHHFLVGKPEKGMHWDHVKARGCTHRNCVWPEHLEQVTPQENTRRSDAGKFWSAKTHCPSGHEYTPANTRLYKGRRFCRMCKRLNRFDRRARQRAAGLKAER